ncbi:cytochrome C biogenesis protein [Candidatus Saccharibacteria bacterium]|nr:cytochrome C biogenesis protein [Candidatus Saccharibacteria bacterium]
MESGIQYGFLLTAAIAGVLTVVSPCVLPMLPIVIGGSTASKSFLKPLRIILALAVSVIVFSLLLKASTALIGVPDYVWRWLSGSILIGFGVLTFWPRLWDRVVEAVGLKKSSQKLLSKGVLRGGAAGDILVGASLGPVFTSCSPAYLTVLGYIAAESFSVGLLYLLVFVVGLVAVLAAVAVFGQKTVAKLAFFSNPASPFRRILALIFITVGVLIFFGWDKDIEAFLLELGLYDWLVDLEDGLPQLE